MKVKVILQSDIAGLGEEGDIKEVAGGYARNYLLPQNLVLPASKGNLNLLNQQRARIEVKLEQRRSDARVIADKLNGVVITFHVRVGEQNRLFGSITATDIADRIKEESGVEIDRRAIELGEPLRMLGTFNVSVRIAHAVTAKVQIILRDQNAPVVAEAVAASPASQPETSDEEVTAAVAE